MAGEFDDILADLPEDDSPTPTNNQQQPVEGQASDIGEVLFSSNFTSKDLVPPTLSNPAAILAGLKNLPVVEQAPTVGRIAKEFFERSESARAIPFEVALDQAGISGITELGERIINSPDSLTKAFGELPNRIKNAITGKEKLEFGDVLRERGVPNSVAAPLGFALEVGTDPLSFVGIGGGKALSKAGKAQLAEEAKRILPDTLDKTPFVLKPEKTVDDFSKEINRLENQIIDLERRKDFLPDFFVKARREAVRKEINELKVDQILVGAADFNNSTIKRTPKALSLITTFMERQGKFGQALARQVERASSQLDRMRAEWLSRFEPTGNINKIFGKMSPEQKLSFMARLEGHVANTGDELVETAFRVADINRKDIAEQALRKGVTVAGKKGTRPFIARENYLPHYILDPVDVINTSGEALEESLKYSVKTGKFRDVNEARKVWEAYSEAARSAFKDIDVPVNSKTKAFFDWVVKTGDAEDVSQAAFNFKKHIQRARTPKFNSLETERSINIPFYDVSPERVLTRYYSGAAKRLSEIDHFGLKGEFGEVADTLINKISEEAGEQSAKDINEMMNLIVGNKLLTDAGIRNAVQMVRNLEAASKLTFAFVMNSTQLVNSASVIGLRNTIKGFADRFTSEGQEYAFKAGAVFNEYTQALYGVGGDDITAKFAKLVLEKLTPFQAIERNNRLVTALGAKHYVDDLARDLIQGQGKTVGAVNAARQLRKMDIRPERVLAEGKVLMDDYFKASGNITTRTQFRARAQDAPLWASSDWGKIVNQFKNFIENQWRFMREEILKEAQQGNLAPIARYSVLAPTVGKEAREIKQRITGQNPKLNVKTDVEKLLEGAADLGAVGMMYDILRNVQFNRESWVLNLIPAAADASRLTADAFLAVEPMLKKFAGRDDSRILNLKPLTKTVATTAPVASFFRTPIGDALKTEDEKKRFASRVLREAVEKNVDLSTVKEGLSERFGFSKSELIKLELNAKRNAKQNVKEQKKKRDKAAREGGITQILRSIGFEE